MPAAPKIIPDQYAFSFLNQSTVNIMRVLPRIINGIMGASGAGKSPADRAMVEGKMPIRIAGRTPMRYTARIKATLTIGPVSHCE